MQLIKENQLSNSFSESAFLIMGVEMIVLAILSYFMLKYKYYKHHIISMALFIACGISCDLFLDAYEEMKQFTFLINFIICLNIFEKYIFMIKKNQYRKILN